LIRIGASLLACSKIYPQALCLIGSESPFFPALVPSIVTNQVALFRHPGCLGNIFPSSQPLRPSQERNVPPLYILPMHLRYSPWRHSTKTGSLALVGPMCLAHRVEPNNRQPIAVRFLVPCSHRTASLSRRFVHSSISCVSLSSYIRSSGECSGGQCVGCR
jgi:hypothetical protein